MKESLKLYRV